MADSLVPPPEEHLTTGWEPDVPAEDTLVRQAVLVHASWPLLLAEAAGRPHRRTGRWAGAWLSDRGALANPVVLLRPLDDPAERLEEIARLIPAHVPYLLVSPWPTDDLTRHGLVLVGHPPLMVRLPTAAASPPPVPGHLTVREVLDTDELAIAEQVLVEGYPMPEMQPLRRGDLFGAGMVGSRTRVWLAWHEDRAVAVSAAHHTYGVTLVEYVATLPPARGLGAGAAVTWAATLSHAGAPAVLVASDDGRPVYERMGFLAIERWTAWLRPGAGAPSAGVASDR